MIGKKGQANMLDGLNLNIGLGGETSAAESETSATPRPDVENVIIIGSGQRVGRLRSTPRALISGRCSSPATKWAVRSL